MSQSGAGVLVIIICSQQGKALDPLYLSYAGVTFFNFGKSLSFCQEPCYFDVPLSSCLLNYL